MNHPKNRYGAGISIRVSHPAHQWLKDRKEATGLSMAELTTRLIRQGMRAEGLTDDQLRELEMLD